MYKNIGRIDCASLPLRTGQEQPCTVAPLSLKGAVPGAIGGQTFMLKFASEHIAAGTSVVVALPSACSASGSACVSRSTDRRSSC